MAADIGAAAVVLVFGDRLAMLGEAIGYRLGTFIVGFFKGERNGTADQ